MPNHRGRKTKLQNHPKCGELEKYATNPRGEKFKQLKKTLLRGIRKIRDLTIAAVKLNNRNTSPRGIRRKRGELEENAGKKKENGYFI